ncbi:MAG: 50S ribosomal protein L32 [Firmicutes bacterium]|nr:50S ribosomal protein L32 [Bacillota bacterium]
MANPKRKHSSTRGAKRRTHWKASVPSITDCPQCHEPKLPHRACSNCGYYDGRQVVKVAE